MRIKLVAPVRDLNALMLQLKGDREVIPKGSTAYVETLLFLPAGAYGAPDLYGVRVWNEDEDHAVLVHFGQDLRHQKEDIVDRGSKSELIYRLQSLGYQQLGEYHVFEWRFRWTEFFGDVLTFSDFGSFIRVYREFPGNDLKEFADRQRRAFSFLRHLGFSVNDLLPYDVRGVIVMMLLKAAQDAAKEGASGSTPQQ